MSFLSGLGSLLPILGTVAGTAIGGPLGPIIGSALGSAGGAALRGGDLRQSLLAGGIGGATQGLAGGLGGSAATAGGKQVLSGATREVGANAVKQSMGDQLKKMLPMMILGGLGGAAFGGAPGAMLGAGGMGLMRQAFGGGGAPAPRPMQGPEVSWGAPSVFDTVARGLYGPER